MISERSQLLDRLRTAVQKVKFLLSFSATRWVMSALAGSSPTPRRLSFKDPPGLLDCAADDYYEVGSSFTPSTTSSPVLEISRSIGSSSEMSRSTSDASSSDDIDSRAEIFIANFYKHIQMERQVSLELRYCKENGLETISPV